MRRTRLVTPTSINHRSRLAASPTHTATQSPAAPTTRNSQRRRPRSNRRSKLHSSSSSPLQPEGTPQVRSSQATGALAGVTWTRQPRRSHPSSETDTHPCAVGTSTRPSKAALTSSRMRRLGWEGSTTSTSTSTTADTRASSETKRTVHRSSLGLQKDQLLSGIMGWASILLFRTPLLNEHLYIYP